MLIHSVLTSAQSCDNIDDQVCQGFAAKTNVCTDPCLSKLCPRTCNLCRKSSFCMSVHRKKSETCFTHKRWWIMFFLRIFVFNSLSTTSYPSYQCYCNCKMEKHTLILFYIFTREGDYEWLQWAILWTYLYFQKSLIVCFYCKFDTHALTYLNLLLVYVALKCYHCDGVSSPSLCTATQICPSKNYVSLIYP